MLVIGQKTSAFSEESLPRIAHESDFHDDNDDNDDNPDGDQEYDDVHRADSRTSLEGQMS